MKWEDKNQFLQYSVNQGTDTLRTALRIVRLLDTFEVILLDNFMCLALVWSSTVCAVIQDLKMIEIKQIVA